MQVAMPLRPIDQDLLQTRLIAHSMRVWRRAHDRARPPQPDLARLLARHGMAMLAPVLDGLCRAFEHALCRPIRIGAGRPCSEDERTLAQLLDGGLPPRCLDCPAPSADLLHCALCSTRIMLSLALPARGTARG